MHLLPLSLVQLQQLSALSFSSACVSVHGITLRGWKTERGSLMPPQPLLPSSWSLFESLRAKGLRIPNKRAVASVLQDFSLERLMQQSVEVQ